MQLNKKSDFPPEPQLRKQIFPTSLEATQSQANSLPNTPKKKSRFSCLGLLMVFFLLIIGGAMALPNFLNCANKAKQSESKQYVGSINRAQQAYLLENKVFPRKITDLKLGIKTQTQNYQYSIRSTKTSAFSYGISRTQKKDLKSYVGSIFLVPVTHLDSKKDKDEMTIVTILCEGNFYGQTRSAEPTLQNNVPTCGDNTKEISRY